jgi:CRP-like cAMP-binding protein
MNISERLLFFIATKLLPYFGAVDAQGKATVQLPMRKAELAMALGVQAETLSRAIKRLKKDGLAEVDHMTVILPSLRAVEDHLEEELSVIGRSF